MSDPTVCCILLTRDRPELARRAVECFRAQTYPHKLLLVYDTGDPTWFDEFRGSNQMQQWTPQGASGATVAALRNSANNSSPRMNVFIHWDDDDWSHPNRIAEQVALLQSSGADCVGYRECLFWREGASAGVHTIPEGAWLYSNGDPRMVIGSSMCYWRAVWEKHPFSEMNGPNPRVRGEDQEFRKGIKCMGVSAVNWDEYGSSTRQHPEWPIEPRMICRIHAGNAQHYPVETLTHYRRAPQWDETVRSVLN